MKNPKTTIAGIIIAIVLALLGIFQPVLTGAPADYYTLIPAAAIAIVGILQKDIGSWQTTIWGSIGGALIAGAQAFQADHSSIWPMILAMVTIIGGSLTKDHNKGQTTPVVTSTGSGSGSLGGDPPKISS